MTDILIPLFVVVLIASIVAIFVCALVAVGFAWRRWKRPAQSRTLGGTARKWLCLLFCLAAGVIGAAAAWVQIGLIGPVMRDYPKGEVGGMLSTMQAPFYVCSIGAVVALLSVAWGIGRTLKV